MSDISFILLYVEDVARSAAFYSRLLEKPIPESSANFAMLPAAPGLMLGLWRRGEVEPKAAGGPGAAEIAVALADDAAVEAAHARWRGLGVAIAQPPTRMDFGFTFVGLDPDGHRLRAFAPARG
ncbi:MAG: VOC family protein [Pseudomonadota bacterium]|nr:VOC family protein [Pseudomonadota bacterium]